MILVALTGGIASGKTTILKFIKNLNIPTHDSDQVVKNLYNNAPNNFIKFLTSIGLKKTIKKNKINKYMVREIVLKNKNLLKKLEKFTHLKVKNSRNKFIDKNKIFKKKLVVIDIPLLFENNLQKNFDYIILAHSDKKTRVNRALKRNKMTKKNLLKIIKLQIPDKDKIKKSSFVINTSKTKKETSEQILFVLKNIELASKQK